MFPFYIKKEDARDVAKWQRRSLVIVMVSVSLVFGIMQFFVLSKLTILYREFNFVIPAAVQYSPQVSLSLFSISAFFSLYLIFSQPDYTKIDSVIKKYKDGELIKTRELMEVKYEFLVLGFMALMVAYLVFTIILPIYNFSSNY